MGIDDRNQLVPDGGRCVGRQDRIVVRPVADGDGGDVTGGDGAVHGDRRRGRARVVIGQARIRRLGRVVEQRRALLDHRDRHGSADIHRAVGVLHPQDAGARAREPQRVGYVDGRTRRWRRRIGFECAGELDRELCHHVGRGDSDDRAADPVHVELDAVQCRRQRLVQRLHRRRVVGVDARNQDLARGAVRARRASDADEFIGRQQGGVRPAGEIRAGGREGERSRGRIERSGQCDVVASRIRVRRAGRQDHEIRGRIRCGVDIWIAGAAVGAVDRVDQGSDHCGERIGGDESVVVIHRDFGAGAIENVTVPDGHRGHRVGLDRAADRDGGARVGVGAGGAENGVERQREIARREDRDAPVESIGHIEIGSVPGQRVGSLERIGPADQLGIG